MSFGTVGMYDQNVAKLFFYLCYENLFYIFVTSVGLLVSVHVNFMKIRAHAGLLGYGQVCLLTARIAHVAQK